MTNKKSSKEDILVRVQKIVENQLGVVNKEEKLEPDNTFSSLGADSLDTVELVMAIEEEFKIQIPDEDAGQIETLQQAVNYIDNVISKED
uniref:Acyl carrier protein n=1 Tax=Spyridia filamentosa TaxID=196632 RepID=A0A1Z1MJW9_SPYFI|nr:acyl carrier protein [Spyridia filamentosa]ARW66236.1 acyl carrier protein [Spyridia filamentosa]